MRGCGLADGRGRRIVHDVACPISRWTTPSPIRSYDIMYHFDKTAELAQLNARPTIADPVSCSDDRDDLRTILDDGCSLAIWKRTPSTTVRNLATTFDRESIEDIDSTIPAIDAARYAAALLGAAGYDIATAVALAEEIGCLSECLGLVIPTETLRLRLEVIETDACRRFHADMVAVRLLATLRGPGTQWIRADAPDAIEEIPSGAVALFKGRLLDDKAVILHRSPPIAGTGQDRLVLVIDPVRRPFEYPTPPS